MAEVIGVRFRNSGKIYYFDPGSEKLSRGERAVVETARGLECGVVAMSNREVSDSSIIQPLRKMIRKANREDLRRVEENCKREEAAFKTCEQKIAEHGLEMKLVEVEYTFDNSKILFYFTADGRVDFRELVKDLAGLFRTRIELRQIGVRDEAKMLGGIGICGRPFCCGTFLNGFQPVSIKMAKEQGLSLNPVKISGACGRLMCCLKYEQEAYQDLIKSTPRVGALVSTPDGKGVVVEQILLTRKLSVRLDQDPEAAPKAFSVDDVKVLRDGRDKPERRDKREKRAEDVPENAGDQPPSESAQKEHAQRERDLQESQRRGNNQRGNTQKNQQRGNRSQRKRGPKDTPATKAKEGKPAGED